MKKIFILVSALFLSACTTTAPFSPPQAMLYSDFKAPLSIDFDKTELGTKRGKASTYSFLGLISVGDASIQAAAKNGHIKQINHADYEHFNLLVFQKTNVYVYGE